MTKAMSFAGLSDTSATQALSTGIIAMLRPKKKTPAA